MVGFIIWMPYGANLVAYKYEQKTKSSEPRKMKPLNEHTYQGYQAPDEILQQEKITAKTSGVNRITTDDIPIKLHLNQPHLKKRKQKIDIDNDPNTYDYDIDHLSDDDTLPVAHEEISESV